MNDFERVVAIALGAVLALMVFAIIYGRLIAAYGSGA